VRWNDPPISEIALVNPGDDDNDLIGPFAWQPSSLATKSNPMRRS
jgi:hypothetical protein